MRCVRPGSAWFLVWLLLPAAPAAELRVDFAAPAGRLRALHGINKGPRVPGGLVDLTAAQRAFRPPLTRLHDCGWPTPDVVDMHVVFPRFEADPARPENYDFLRTDAYVAAARATGAELVYRLGETIEHDRPVRHAHPPRDFAHWAAIAAGVAARYRDAGVKHWEIWNEPDNRPACWTGTDEDYFRLYAVTARTLKARFPELRVGGPAVGNTGALRGGRLEATAFVTGFLAFCRREALPLDFFSWHCYAADPEEFAARARGVRALLDAHGFAATESHLNEWNYLPDGAWTPWTRAASPADRRRAFARMTGAEGAAFLVAALAAMQDAPVDAACLFHGELGTFGLFDEFAAPQKNHGALRAWAALLETPRRVPVNGALPPRLAVLAGVADGAGEGRPAAQLLVANRGPATTLRIVPDGLPRGVRAWRRVISAAASFDDEPDAPATGDTVEPVVPAASVTLLTWR